MDKWMQATTDFCNSILLGDNLKHHIEKYLTPVYRTAIERAEKAEKEAAILTDMLLRHMNIKYIQAELSRRGKGE